MKGLNVLNKLLVLCSVLCFTAVHADELSDILSANNNKLFDYDFQSNIAQSNTLKKSWINPILLQYSKNYSKQFVDKTVQTGSFTIGIDQPIFRSGGIYFSIKYAQALSDANDVTIQLKKREMIGKAVKLLFEINKMKLIQKKQKLLLANDTIDIRQKRESYEAGLMDSSFLDQAILKHRQNEIKKLETETSLFNLEKNFSLLSDKNPKNIRLPKLKLISAERYKGSNLELVREKLNYKEKGYSHKITWVKYLPSISVQARYTDADLNPFFARPGIENKYFAYGFRISMPIDINMFSDIETSNLAKLKAEAEVIERKKAIDAEYKFIRKKLRIIDKKIKFAKKDEKLYNRLYKTTKNLERAGEKTSFDTKMMLNSLKIRKLDQKIYNFDKQIELIGLYVKVANND